MIAIVRSIRVDVNKLIPFIVEPRKVDEMDKVLAVTELTSKLDTYAEIANRVEPVRVDTSTVLPCRVEYDSTPSNSVENVSTLPVRVFPVNVDTPRFVVMRLDPMSVDNTVTVFAVRVLPVSVENVILDVPNVLAIIVDGTVI